MKITDTLLIRKRLNRVARNHDTAGKILEIDKTIQDQYTKRRREEIHKLLNCSKGFQLNNAGYLKSWFCKSKLCLVCNSIRSGTLINSFESVQKFDFRQVVLTLQNFTIKESGNIFLKTRKSKHNRTGKKKVNILDLFQTFWNNTQFKKKYKPSDYSIIRTFEITENKQNRSKWFNTLHPHFHCIVISHKKNTTAETIAADLVKYWLLWIDKQGIQVDRSAQYNEPPEKSIQENFKYITKIKDASPELINWIIVNTYRRRLFVVSGKKIQTDFDYIPEELTAEQLETDCNYIYSGSEKYTTEQDGIKKTFKRLFYTNFDTGEIINN